MNYHQESVQFNLKADTLSDSSTEEVGDVLRLAALADWCMGKSDDLEQVGNLLHYYNRGGHQARMDCVPAHDLSGRAAILLNSVMCRGVNGRNATMNSLGEWLRRVLNEVARGLYDGQEDPASAVAAGGSDEGSHHAAVAG
jgi:hypothetical protein